MAGAAIWAGRNKLGLALVVVLAGGVLWSNAAAYTNSTVAPRARLAELQKIGTLIDGKGPTFDNEYEVYGSRHFLRAGDPVQPAELRSVTLPLLDGHFLTKSAWADLDAFPLSTLQPYRSLVVTSSPTASRPPSSYREVWRGRYYTLYQRPAVPSQTVVRHIPVGDSVSLPYCGQAQDTGALSLCAANPVAVPQCSQLLALGRQAQAAGGHLVAYTRPAPIVVRADQTQWPGLWIHDAAARTLTPTVPGTLVAHIAVASSQTYALWLGGSFARGFTITVDGHSIGRVSNQLGNIGGYVPVTDVPLSAGVHTFTLTYPHISLRPGSADQQELTTLATIVLQQQRPPAQMLSVPATSATALCGKPLDWVEIVR
jgi:hypothetical protein